MLHKLLSSNSMIGTNQIQKMSKNPENVITPVSNKISATDSGNTAEAAPINVKKKKNDVPYAQQPTIKIKKNNNKQFMSLIIIFTSIIIEKKENC